MGTLLALLAIIFTVVQTTMAARMAWRAKLKLGAVGLGFLAVASVVTPVVVYWRLR
jgi:hypothetical protein